MDFREVFKEATLHFEDKSERYDRTVTRRLMGSAGWPEQAIRSLIKTQGADFGPTWLTQQYLGDKLAISAHKLKAPVTLEMFIGWGKKKSQLRTLWEAHGEDWPESVMRALVFDRHGDGVGDLVLHDAVNPVWTHSTPSFLLRFEHKSATLWVQRFEDFAKVFGNQFSIL